METLGSLANHAVESLHPCETLEAAARRMKETGLGFLPVTLFRRLEGVLTDRDIILRAAAEGADPAGRRVKEIMTPSPVCARAADSLEIARTLLARLRIRRLPVTDQNGMLTGLVTLNQIARLIDAQASAALLRRVYAHEGF